MTTNHRSPLDELNSRMSGLDDSFTADFGPPQFPLCVIAAPPRSASTLLHQLIISTNRIGYVSNIMARFWEAPYLGAQLHREIANPDFVSSCRSEFGVGPAPEDPHEWSWFWQKHFRLKGDDHYISDANQVDWGRLGQKLSAIQRILEAPLIIDNVFAMNALPLLKEYFGAVLPIQLRRHPYYVCNSVINLRLRRLGDISALRFHLPRNARELKKIDDPIEQIVLQVKSVESEIAEMLTDFAPEDVFNVDYDNLKADAPGVMAAFREFLERRGCPVQPKPGTPRDPEPNRNRPDMINLEFKDRLDRYYAKYFGDNPCEAI